MMLEDIPYALAAERVSQIGQGPHDAVIAPGAVLAGHPYHQIFDLFGDARTANGLGALDTITLLGRACAMPSQDSVGLSYRRNLFQSLFAELLAQLGECL